MEALDSLIETNIFTREKLTMRTTSYELAVEHEASQPRPRA
jgi:hypothetical protein